MISRIKCETPYPPKRVIKWRFRKIFQNSTNEERDGSAIQGKSINWIKSDCWYQIGWKIEENQQNIKKQIEINHKKCVNP